MPTPAGRPTKKERQLEIWKGFSPFQRDYQRFVLGWIPEGGSWEPETEAGKKAKQEIEKRPLFRGVERK